MSVSINGFRILSANAKATALSVVLGLAAACSAPTIPPIETAPERPEIKSTDFVLLPCGPGEADKPCALLMAGGKRVLFGAPAGVAATLTEDDLANLDAVMLFSLNGRDIEGLDEVRNESWLAGRDAPLPVSGPEGTEDLLAALNLAYEQSDALAFIEQGAKGGFDAAVLALGGNDGVVFNTGDLVVTGMIDGDGEAGFFIDYDGYRAIIEPCGMLQATNYMEGSEYTLDCNHGDVNWPLSEVVFINRNAERMPPQ